MWFFFENANLVGWYDGILRLLEQSWKLRNGEMSFEIWPLWSVLQNAVLQNAAQNTPLKLKQFYLAFIILLIACILTVFHFIRERVNLQTNGNFVDVILEFL